jgi:hypothetical protein
VQAILAFGVWRLVAPLLLWVPLFAVGAGLLGLSTVRRMRRKLVAAHLPTRLPTALIGILLLVLMPLGAGFLGGTFALKRGLGSVIEEGGDPVIAWAMTQAARSLDVREKHGRIRFKELLEKWHQRHQTVEVAPGPLAIFRQLPALFEQRFWSALDAYGGTAFTWDELVVRTRVVMREQVLHPIADEVRRSAWADLLLLLGALAVVHGSTLGGVWLYCRRRLKVET